MEDFDSLNEKQLESLERGLSDLKNNRVMTSDEFWKGLLSNKEQQLLIDEAYENWLMNTKKMVDKEIIKKFIQHTPNIHKEEFINKCKTNPDFSEKWGLTIEERELSLEERFNIRYPGGKFSVFQENYPNTHYRNDPHGLLDAFNIPTKIIILSYHNKTIESYE